MTEFQDANGKPIELNRAYMRNNGTFYVITKLSSRSFTAEFEGGFSKVIQEGYNWLSRLSTPICDEDVKERIQSHKNSARILEKTLEKR